MEVWTKVRYTGPMRDFLNKCGLCIAEGDGWVKVQFDELPGFYHGWHKMPQTHVEVLPRHDELPPLPDDCDELVDDSVTERQLVYGKVSGPTVTQREIARQRRKLRELRNIRYGRAYGGTAHQMTIRDESSRIREVEGIYRSEPETIYSPPGERRGDEEYEWFRWMFQVTDEELAG